MSITCEECVGWYVPGANTVLSVMAVNFTVVPDGKSSEC